MSKKNLVMTVGTGYKYYHLQPFVESLRNTGYKGDIVLFCKDIDQKTSHKLKSKKVKLVNMNDAKYRNKKISLMNYRFTFFYDYLRKNKKKYNKVFIADVRDVAFQKDPFDYRRYDKINYFFENRKIKDCRINSYVFEKAGNKKIFEKYKDKNISCAGTTLGDIKEILKYLRLMDKKLSNQVEPIDQGYHNVIFHTGKIKGAKGFYNFEGPILTLSQVESKDINYDSSKKILNKDNTVINVIHQYDRNLYLLYHFNSTKAFILTFSNKLKIKLRRGIKRVLFNIPVLGKHFRKKYYDPTRF